MEIEVATSGTVDRDDRCIGCGRGMLYRVHDEEAVTEMFCGNSKCHLFLMEIAAQEGEDV